MPRSRFNPNPDRLKDITGLRFGRLIVIEKTNISAASGKLWRLRCDCGNEVLVTKCNIDAGYYQSCGCLRREFAVKHGMCETSEYQAWADMISRCLNPSNPRFKDYGGRGIGVCDRWRSSFEAFLEDMGTKPSGFLIDRKDNDGDYEPGNCRWVSSKESARNRRTNHFLEFQGERLTIVEWAERIGRSPSTIHARLRRGLPMEKVLSPESRYKTYRKSSVAS